MAKNKELKTNIQSERERVQNELALLSSADSASVAADNQLMIDNVRATLVVLKDADADYEKKGLAIRSITDTIAFDRENTRFDFNLKLVK